MTDQFISCEAIGAVCRGYFGPTTRMYEYSASQQRMLMIKEPRDSPAPVAVKTTLREMRIFDLLRTETVQQLVGPFDRGFWTVDVLQAMRQYPAMWYACLALAAIQKQRMILELTPAASENARRERHALYVFSLQQYGHSVKSVISIVRKPRSQLTEADKEAILLSAILFSAIGSLKGDVEEAKVHARHCIQLFQCWWSWWAPRSLETMRNIKRTDCVLREEKIIAIVTHFECQYPNALGAAKRTPYRCGTGSFVSAEEAYYEFTQLLCELNAVAHHAVTQHQDASQHTPARRPEPDGFLHYRREFRAWQRRFNSLRVANFDKLTDRQGIRVLGLLFVGIEPVLAMDSAEVVRSWDEHHARVWDLYRRSGAILKEEDEQCGIAKGHSWDSRSFIQSVSPSPSSR